MKPAETTPPELEAKAAGQTPSRSDWIANLRALYEGDTRRAHRFQYGLLAFDSLTVVFIVFTSFLPRTDVLEAFDVLFGLVILADVAARITISRQRRREVLHPITLVDFLVVVSFLAPITGQGAGFLRILRLLRSYKLLSMLRKESAIFRQHEEVITAAVNLFVFTFVMTAIVYQTQHWTNPTIENYADALYFTMTTLTTTGFGDITLPGTKGRLTTVVIMICGVTLFLRLAQVLFRPTKVRFPCDRCGLQRHEPDAVHCKACGAMLKIPDEGD